MDGLSDRNLLFGLLALQNGIIDQSALVAAFHEWTREKSRSLAEILLARGAIDADDRATLSALAAKHVKRHGGDPEKSLAALPTDRSVFDGLTKLKDADLDATLDRVSLPSTGTNPDSGTTGTFGATAGKSGRFRILRPHARGGLGEVFVALDNELHREVALKQILDHHADDPTSQTRFVLEAEITGGLEHPGIVPVYGLGSYGDGRHYYAMRFIRGDSLKDAIAAFHKDEELRKDPGKRSLALRKLLRRFVDVCNAIDYAHSRGVIHRDLKPANVIVGKHGETLVVDWGLAKAVGKSEPRASLDERTLMPNSASGSAATLQGSALGTPAYMSPEQAAGDLDDIGPRSDVYSLGATLYCLLTGKPPFEGNDLGAILRAVRAGDFLKPRQVDPTIDRALEAVCLKAMSVNPKDRHATARALADDVDRWSADEPTSAWREPVSVRARRWMRRNRTLVSVAAASVLVAIVGLSAVLAVQTRANADLKEAYFRLDLSNRREIQANADLKEANARERARFALAQEAIRLFHTGVSEDLLLKQKEFDALRTKLLRGARDFYKKLESLLQGQADRESRLSLAQSYREVGALTEMIETAKDALAVERQALGILEGLAGENPGDSEILRQTGLTRYAIGELLYRSDGGTKDALASLGMARDALRSALAAKPSEIDIRADLADVESLIAAISDEIRATDSDRDAAMDEIRQACDAWESLVKADPGSARYRFGLAGNLENYALKLAEMHQYDEAFAAYDRSRRLTEKLWRDDPANHLHGGELIRVLGNLAHDLREAGRSVESAEAIARAREVANAMIMAGPTILLFQRNLAWIEHHAAWAAYDNGHTDEASAALARAEAARLRLLAANPDDTRHREQLAWVLRDQAWFQLRAGRAERARPAAERSAAILEQAVAANPDRTDIEPDLARSYAMLAKIEAAEGHADRARALFAKAVAISERRAKAGRSDAVTRSLLAGIFRDFGGALLVLGKGDEAAAALRRSIALLESLEKPTPDDLYGIACARSLLSSVSTGSATGDDEEAKRAVACLRRATEAGYRILPWIRFGDPDLEPIRSRDDFKALMMDMDFPGKPFAQ